MHEVSIIYHLPKLTYLLTCWSVAGLSTFVSGHTF